jgi:lysophospholipase L1-like esterase
MRRFVTFALTLILVTAMEGRVRTNSRLGRGGSLSENPFSPASLPNLTLDLEPSGVASVSDGSKIATWTDPVGNSATQGTDANRPTKQTVANNGASFGVARFAGSHNMATASFLGSGYNTALTFFIAHSQTNNSLTVSTSSGGVTWYTGQATAQLFNTNSLSDTQIGASISTQTSFHVRSFRYNGSTKSNRLDGFARTTESATGNLGLSGALTIGKLSSGGFDFSGDISHIIVYQRALSDAEMLSVERYLGSAVGLNMFPQIVCDGDSLTAGTGVLAGDDYPSQLQVLLGGSGAWEKGNYGGAGNTITQLSSDAATQIDGLLSGLKPKNIVIVWAGTNDIAVDSRTGAQAEALLNTYCTARRTAGYKVVVLTMISRGMFNGTQEGYRQDFNTAVRANWTTYADALVDVDANTVVGGVGTYANTTYYQNDQIHLKAAGFAAVAAALQPVVNSL